MTQTFIVIKNIYTNTDKTFRKSGALTAGLYECPMRQLFISEKYPIESCEKMIIRLIQENWSECNDLHPAELFNWAEILIYILYDEHEFKIKEINL